MKKKSLGANPSNCPSYRLHYLVNYLSMALIFVSATQVDSILFIAALNGLWHFSSLLEHYAMLPRPLLSSIFSSVYTHP